MSDIVNYLTANWGGIVAILVGAVVLAEKVTKVTSTTADDAVVAKVEEVLKNLGIDVNAPPKA